MKKYYVYCLINPLTNQPFYIGKGKRVKGRSARWRDHISEARRWNTLSRCGNKGKLLIIKKLLEENIEPLCDIIYETNVEEDAHCAEENLIRKYGRVKFDENGILTNLTKGGEGKTSKKKYDLERINHLRAKMTGKNNPMYGKHHTQRTKNLISETRKQKFISGEMVPTKHTEKWKSHLRENNPGGKATAKTVLQIDPNTGKVINKWKSMRQAGKTLKIKSWRNISTCCNVYKNRLCGGFYWRLDNDKGIINEKLKNIDMLNMRRCGKPIHQIKDGIIIKTWSTMSEIAKYYNVVPSVITSMVKNKQIFNEYYWIYA